MNLLWFLVVGLVAGWLAGVLVKGGGFGVIGDLVVGVIASRPLCNRSLPRLGAMRRSDVRFAAVSGPITLGRWC